MIFARRRFAAWLVTASGLIAVLGGCAAFPRSGPDDYQIRSDATTSLKATDGSGSQVALAYAVVDLSPTVLAAIRPRGPGSLYQSFGGGRGAPPQIRVGIGDLIQVTLFEAAAGGLFIPLDAGSRPGNFITLPEQTVDENGNISVPYAGLVPANGRTIPAIEADIVNRLENRAIEPQAVVSLITQSATTVSVIGEVRGAGTFPVNPAGDTVVDMISRGGGLNFPGYESYVTLQRKDRKATVFFDQLIDNPQENIYVSPGDTIYVYRQQRTFLAFGASGLNGQFDFETQTLSMAEGVGRAGGLLDDRADPGMTFLYRVEPRSTLESMGVDLSKFDPARTLIPTIYRANFRNPTEFFLAQDFPMEDKDIIYVSNADVIELYKFLELVNSISATAGGIAADQILIHEAITGTW